MEYVYLVKISTNNPHYKSIVERVFGNKVDAMIFIEGYCDIEKVNGYEVKAEVDMEDEMFTLLTKGPTGQIWIEMKRMKVN